jgi:hypothetical protein
MGQAISTTQNSKGSYDARICPCNFNVQDGSINCDRPMGACIDQQDLYKITPKVPISRDGMSHMMMTPTSDYNHFLYSKNLKDDISKSVPEVKDMNDGAFASRLTYFSEMHATNPTMPIAKIVNGKSAFTMDIPDKYCINVDPCDDNMKPFCCDTPANTLIPMISATDYALISGGLPVYIFLFVWIMVFALIFAIVYLIVMYFPKFRPS